MNGTVEKQQRAFSFGRHAIATDVELRISGDLDEAAWEQLGRNIVRIADASAWWVGDWLAYGEWRYGEKYRAALDELALSYDRVRDYAYVAGNVPAAVRRPDLSFYHHRTVAKLIPDDQERWLARAASEGWSVAQLRDELAEHAAEPAGHPAILEQIRVTIDPDRHARWQAAAQAVDATVADWAIAVLDVAAEQGAP